jgi:hypothetical protein
MTNLLSLRGMAGKSKFYEVYAEGSENKQKCGQQIKAYFTNLKEPIRRPSPLFISCASYSALPM